MGGVNTESINKTINTIGASEMVVSKRLYAKKNRSKKQKKQTTSNQLFQISRKKNKQNYDSPFSTPHQLDQQVNGVNF